MGHCLVDSCHPFGLLAAFFAATSFPRHDFIISHEPPPFILTQSSKTNTPAPMNCQLCWHTTISGTPYASDAQNSRSCTAINSAFFFFHVLWINQILSCFLARQYRICTRASIRKSDLFWIFYFLFYFRLFKISVDLYLMLLERISQASACLWHPLGPDWIM